MGIFHQLGAACVKLAPSFDCRLLDRHVSAVSVEWTAKVQGWLSARYIRYSRLVQVHPLAQNVKALAIREVGGFDRKN
jgi:hypothetical protein